MGDQSTNSTIKDEASIFVRSWVEKPIVLVFRCNMESDCNLRDGKRTKKKLDEVWYTPAVLARTLFERYPVLSQFQPDVDCRLEAGDMSSLARMSGGGGRVYHFRASRFDETLAVFIPLFPGGGLRSRGGLDHDQHLEDFAEDFVVEHSPFVFDGCLEFTISYQTLHDPLNTLKRLKWVP